MWGVLLALVFKFCGAHSEVIVKHALQALFPSGVDLLCVALGNGLEISFHGREESSEAVERITIECDGVGHNAFGDESVVLHTVDGILETASL